MKLPRRRLFASLGSLPLLGAATRSNAAGIANDPACTAPGDWSQLHWERGLEGQRQADLGDGSFLNPILAGDHPDPSVLKDGDDYYLTFSSFDAYPGIVIWHSRDLVNWQPVTAALTTPIGSVWAPELCKHAGRYYVYIPARQPGYRSNYVIWGDDIRGPWSKPIDLKLPDHIDPGHVVDAEGNRYLALSGGDLVPLTADGLATAGPVRHIYDPWRYPDDWVVESFSPEGPKLLYREGWYYMITAVGGTAGPPTGHMVIMARARTLDGPWEHAPDNPILRTQVASEKWWSRGHATPVEGPDGSWWLIYHGYENGFWTLGRQCLLDPVEWTADGWLKARGGDLSQPIPKPRGGSALLHGMALSDDFSCSRLGTQWAFYDPAADELQRLHYESGSLVLTGKGSSPADCSPLTFIAGDLAYEVTVECERVGEAQGGLLLFYSRRLYCGLGFGPEGLVMHRYGLERRAAAPPGLGRRLWLRITNDHHIVSIHYSLDGQEWVRFGVQMEVSGYHHNVAGDFLSLRPGIYAAGTGELQFRQLAYRALQGGGSGS